MTLGRDNFCVVSIFSGAMGLDLGIDSVGCFSIKACIEKEHSFCESIRLNKKAGHLPGDLRVFEGDITQISPESVLEAINLKPGEVDLLVGGPPCQSFSTAGRRGTTQDPRGTLLWQFLKYVEVMKPKFFLMENVRGLISAALKHRPLNMRPDKGGPPLAKDEMPGSVVRLFSESLQNIPGAKYHMDCFEVNAVNYGAPQIRERVLFIGNRFNAKVSFPQPTHGNPEHLETGNYLPGVEKSTLLPWATLRDAIGDLHEINPTILDFSPRKKHFLAMVPQGANWRSLPIDIQIESMGSAYYAKGGRSGWWRRLTFDLPCPTLVTMPNHASTSLCHPTETRALTLKEYARIQEFPDDWLISGNVSEQYAQIGNAVPTRLGKVAGNVIARELFKLKTRGWTPYEQQHEPFSIIYIQSHVRTRKWFKGGETYIWADGCHNETATYAKTKTNEKITFITT